MGDSEADQQEEERNEEYDEEYDKEPMGIPIGKQPKEMQNEDNQWGADKWAQQGVDLAEYTEDRRAWPRCRVNFPRGSSNLYAGSLPHCITQSSDYAVVRSDHSERELQEGERWV